jgi:hypothetical protein
LPSEIFPRSELLPEIGALEVLDEVFAVENGEGIGGVSDTIL